MPYSPEQRRAHYLKHRERLLAENKLWRSNNKTYRKNYRKKYYQKNKETLTQKHKEWVQKNKDWTRQWKINWLSKNPDYMKKWGRMHPERSLQYFKKKPWVRTLVYINARCTDKKMGSYKYYGGKGIKNYLKASDLKCLWERDFAYEMKRPSIDRIDSSKDYTVENCRYIELKENIQRIKLRRNDLGRWEKAA